MPNIDQSAYRAPRFLKNAHVQTVAPALFKQFINARYERERLELDDGDFLDLDWIKRDHKKLMVITHGLEGSTRSPYIRSISNFFAKKGYDVLAWNCRSCSEEINRNKRLYHHGETEDIRAVLRHANNEKSYDDIYLIGFSMGGNIVLKTMGDTDICQDVPIKAVSAISTPCDLEASSNTLDDPANRIYLYYFKKMIRKKLEAKNKQFPGWLDLSIFETATCWRDIDEVVSTVITNTPNAEAFYDIASSKNYLAGIKVPTLILNASNDPVLTDACNPRDIADKHPNIYLEVPPTGGHVGFPINYRLHSYAERRAASFFAGR